MVIQGDKIRAGTITAEKIIDGAISEVSASSSAGGSYSHAYTTQRTVTLTFESGYVRLSGSVRVKSSSSATVCIKLRKKVSSTYSDLKQWTNYCNRYYWYNCELSAVDTPSPGQTVEYLLVF